MCKKGPLALSIRKSYLWSLHWGFQITNCHKLGGLNNRHVLSYSLEPGSQRSKHWQGLFFLRAVKENFSMSLSKLLVASRVPWLIDGIPLDLHVVFPLYMSVSVAKFPLFIRIPVIWD